MPTTITRSDALYTVEQIRGIEVAAIAQKPNVNLMKRASEAAAQVALRLLNDSIGRGALRDAPVLVATGPGKNGGDAFECAAILARHGCSVTVLVPFTKNAVGADDAVDLTLSRKCSPAFTDPESLSVLGRQRWVLVIDGLFGIGMTRPLEGTWRDVVETLNSIDAPLLALDLPSGLNGDTGSIAAGLDRVKTCVRASHTVTFIGNKPGLHTCDGRDHAGDVTVADLELDPTLFSAPTAVMNRPRQFRPTIHARNQNSHKGNFGNVQIIGGATGMAGAAILSAIAALKAGAGRVLVGFADDVHRPAYVSGHPELMCRSATNMEFVDATLVVGPGLGTSEVAYDLVARACASHLPLILDADALNLVAATPSLQQQLRSRAGNGAPTLLTPHPLEAARLLAIHPDRVQADRLAAARALAARFHATIILKGSGSIIAHEDTLRLNPTGNPALATGGTGDVLAGLCGALIAQGWPMQEAACGAVWIHGAAADLLVINGIGPIGVTAGELVDAIRTILNNLITGRKPFPVAPQ